MLCKTLYELKLADSDRKVHHLALDSRLVKPKGLFFAYPGVTVDGRAYIDQAIARGAIVIVYEDADGFQPTSSPYPDVIFIAKTHLQIHVGEIAARFFDDPSLGMNVIGVTGTNGKTSVTHFIAQALQQHRVDCAVLGTVGNGLLLGLEKSMQTTLDPIQLQHRFWQFKKEGIRHTAMEVSSHALVQGRVAGTHFTTAVFTQLSRDHLDYHGTMEAYAAAKAELFQQTGLRYAVINQDDLQGQQFIADYRASLAVVAYSARGEIYPNVPHVVATKISPQPHGFMLEIDSAWGAGELTCGLIGDFNVSNLLATLSVLLLNDIPFEQALRYCAQLKTVRGRMQMLGGENQPIVIIDYAHTPDALEKVLSALRSHSTGKLWCVFGCGGDRDKGKRSLMARVVEQWADHIIVTDDNPRHESSQSIVDDICRGFSVAAAIQVIQDRGKAIAMAVQSANRHDMVLVAGKGHETTQIVGDHVLPFDDVEQAELALANRKQGIPYD